MGFQRRRSGGVGAGARAPERGGARGRKRQGRRERRERRPPRALRWASAVTSCCAAHAAHIENVLAAHAGFSLTWGELRFGVGIAPSD